jgi:hypothetical protein
MCQMADIDIFRHNDSFTDSNIRRRKKNTYKNNLTEINRQIKIPTKLCECP